MSVRDRNLRALAAHHPEAASILEAAPPVPGRVVVSDTPSGVPTAFLDGVSLHSRYDPRRDARAQAEREIDPSATTVVIFGFGLGYAAEAARARFPGLPILVVEPDADVIQAAVAARDLTGFFTQPAVTLYVGDRPEGIARCLESLPLAHPAFLRLRPAFQVTPGPYRAAEGVVHSWLLRKDINVNTLTRFGRLWVRNLCRNMRAFMDCPGIGALSGIFDGMPGLVVAGGPSLDSVLPRIAELARRLLVVSVNTPLKACLHAGVEPDFTVVVDPQYWASRYLDWTVTRRGVLVAEPSTCPRALRRAGAAFYLCSSLFPLGETLEAAVGAKGKLGAGGSVATSAWDLARLLGARPLYAAGLDLGFPGMRTHCRGVYAEETWLSTGGRLSPVEASAFTSLRDIGLFGTRSTSGGTTPTDRRMLLYKWWFENQLALRPEVPSRTLSPDGTAIEGMPLAPLEELLSLPVIRPAIDHGMARVREIHEEARSAQRSTHALRRNLDTLEGELGDLERLSRRGLRETKRLGDLLGRKEDPGSTLKALDDIDRGILGVGARTIAGFLIQSVIHAISGEGEHVPDPGAVVSRSVSMYEGIAESASWQRALIRRAADSLDTDGRFS